MTRIPFIVVHGGLTARCALHVDRKLNVRLIELMRLETDTENQGPAARQLLEKIEFINDLIHSDVPFECLMTCRRSIGMFGAIIDPAATEFEAIKASLASVSHVA